MTWGLSAPLSADFDWSASGLSLCNFDRVSSTERKSVTAGRLYAALATVLFLVGIGGFGTASSGDVTMFGLTMQAKYACFVYFVLGGLFVWSVLEAKKRGVHW